MAAAAAGAAHVLRWTLSDTGKEHRAAQAEGTRSPVRYDSHRLFCLIHAQSCPCNEPQLCDQLHLMAFHPPFTRNAE